MESSLPAAGAHSWPVSLPARLLSDERLARAIGSGSQSAFTTLFSRYHQPLYRYCRSLVGRDEDAQDVLQTTFTKALVALRAAQRDAPLRPWLYRIAHNESVSLLRTRREHTEIPPEIEALGGVQQSAELRERLATLVRDLQELPERQRAALVMREFSGLSHQEIAQAQQTSVASVKQSILEARRSLAESAEGRAMSCERVQQIISDADGRSLRSRRVRAHLRNCSSCAAFKDAMPQRRAAMMALWPILPATGAATLLGRLTGTGTSHGAGTGLAAGSAAKGVGTAVSIKTAVAGVAVIAAAGAGLAAVKHHFASHGRTPAVHQLSAPSHLAQSPQADPPPASRPLAGTLSRRASAKHSRSRQQGSQRHPLHMHSATRGGQALGLGASSNRAATVQPAPRAVRSAGQAEHPSHGRALKPTIAAATRHQTQHAHPIKPTDHAKAHHRRQAQHHIKHSSPSATTVKRKHKNKGRHRKEAARPNSKSTVATPSSSTAVSPTPSTPGTQGLQTSKTLPPGQLSKNLRSAS
ncbi:MAG: sigma-70 family RNA polymerase sigma factor [Solirubrobacteraceae bacterium]